MCATEASPRRLSNLIGESAGKKESDIGSNIIIFMIILTEAFKRSCRFLPPMASRKFGRVAEEEGPIVIVNFCSN
jgi:hypothetical protein